MVLFDGGTAGQFRVEVASKGVEIHLPTLFQAVEQVLQKALWITLRKEIREPPHDQGIIPKGIHFHPHGVQFR